MTLLCFTSAENLRPIPCEYCGGDGEWEEMYWNGHEPMARAHRCTACNGSGEEWIEVAPIEMEDLP
jgi:DnaJ-class molecular chaperone